MAGRRAPLRGGIEWTAAQARAAGMTYGQYVAAANPPAPAKSKPEITAAEAAETAARQKAAARLEELRTARQKALMERRRLLTETLRAARHNKGLSREEAAAALGVHKATIKNWEQAKTRPQERHMRALARLYGLGQKELEGLFEAAVQGGEEATPRQAQAQKTGEALRQIRQRAGLEIMEAAEKLHVTTVAIHKWETGQARPGTQSQFKICLAYGIDMDELQKLLC